MLLYGAPSYAAASTTVRLQPSGLARPGAADGLTMTMLVDCRYTPVELAMTVRTVLSAAV